MISRNKFIDSIKSISMHLKEIRNLDAATREISGVIKTEVGMSFRKLKKISLLGNSTKNLVLRQ